MAEMSPEEVASLLNEARDGWRDDAGLRLVRASRDEVTAELVIEPKHLQAYGIVHGGVHASIVETLASVGAALDAMPRGQSVVGLDNHTSFIRAVRSGTLKARATPITRGRRTQLWEGTIVDETGRIVATGRVRLLCLSPNAEPEGDGEAGR